MSRLRLGIIGCGEAGQILHLPSLRQLPELFDVRVVCDAGPGVAEGVAGAFGIPLALTDPEELLAFADLDAVLVATPDPTHASVALAALAAGKHVLVEKPMCITLREADEIIAAQERTGLVVQVGYMRRHATAFVEARALIGELTGIRLARVHQVLGGNSLIIEPTSLVLRPDGAQPTSIATSMDALVREAIGEVDDARAAAYRLLLSVSSHDISVMRELLGMPDRVLHATARHGGQYLTATFDYGSFVCQFETGIDEIPRFDCHIEVYCGRARRPPRIRHAVRAQPADARRRARGERARRRARDDHAHGVGRCVRQRVACVPPERHRGRRSAHLGRRLQAGPRAVRGDAARDGLVITSRTARSARRRSRGSRR